MLHRKRANTCELSFEMSHRDNMAQSQREWENDSTIDLSNFFPWLEAREEMEEMKEIMSH